MALVHVERGEIIPLGLDLRSFGDRKAEVGEDFGELVHHLADGVHRPRDAFRRGKREIDRFGRELALELGGFERCLALGEGVRHLFAKRMDLRGFGSPRLRVHRPQRLQQLRDLARLAERGHPHGFECGEVGSGGDFLLEAGLKRFRHRLSLGFQCRRA